MADDSAEEEAADAEFSRLEYFECKDKEVGDCEFVLAMSDVWQYAKIDESAGHISAINGPSKGGMDILWSSFIQETSYIYICPEIATTSRFLFILTNKTVDGKLNSHITYFLLVLTMMSFFDDDDKLYPKPTVATRGVEKSISTIFASLSLLKHRPNGSQLKIENELSVPTPRHESS